MERFGFGLIKAMVESRAPFTLLMEEGIDEAYFNSSERSAFRFLNKYIQDYGTYPNLLIIEAESGSKGCFDNLPESDVAFWVSKLKDRWRAGRIKSMTTSVLSMAETARIEQAVDRIGEVYSEIRATYKQTRAVDLKDAEREVLIRHAQVQAGLSGLPGIPFGIPYVDAISGGAQSGDAIVIVGKTGVGKTYLAIRMALSAQLSGRHVLFLCSEMPYQQVARRLLAMESGVSTSHLKRGRLSFFGVDRANQILNSSTVIGGQQIFFRLLPGGIYARVEDLFLAVKEYRPDVLFVDGAYLLRIPGWHGGSRWERHLEIMERLKDNSMTSTVPVVATYQYTKSDPDSMEGVPAGVGQLASIVFSLEYERKEDASNTSPIQYRLLKLLKGRDGESGVIRLLFDMARTRISQDRVLVGYEEDPEGADHDLEDREEDDVPFEEI